MKVLKVAGIIAEYNPFHNGHAYHIEETRKKTGADQVIVVMSGNFVQRGAPAILNKYLRTAMALEHGADLVIELPAVAAISSAEHFATGGVHLLDRLGVVDTLSFGCEASTDAEKELLYFASDLLTKEPEDYQLNLRSLLKQGMSFPAARAEALACCLSPLMPQSSDVTAFRQLIDSPNNILAIEYLKALAHCHSGIQPCMITRVGSQYHDQTLSGTLSSASAIRSLLTDPDKTALQSLESAVPDSVFRLLSDSQKQHAFLQENDFSSMLFFALAEHIDDLQNFDEINPDFAARIRQNLEHFSDWKSFAAHLKTKNRTYTSVSRVFTHLLNGMTNEIRSLAENCQFAPYAHILGFRKTAAPLLKELRQHSRIPILQKFAGDCHSLSASGQALLAVDLRCSRNYNQILYERSGIRQPLDYRQPLIIH